MTKPDGVAIYYRADKWARGGGGIPYMIRLDRFSLGNYLANRTTNPVHCMSVGGEILNTRQGKQIHIGPCRERLEAFLGGLISYVCSVVSGFFFILTRNHIHIQHVQYYIISRASLRFEKRLNFLINPRKLSIFTEVKPKSYIRKLGKQINT